MSSIQIKRVVRRLSLARLRNLNEWLQELIKNTEEAEREEKSSSRKQTIAEQTFENRTYRLENVRCGKEKCKCARGKLHGPYWYSYTRVKDRITSQYVGKSLPKDVEKRMKNRGEK